ncbi:uncharacterized protein LOC126816202 [Patella vulgata]|uniref:uncharacterized protein LOC126816202 n=1 Tax=Patella vulgata TaxID=6465 RepID=UPI00217F6CBD|nr:uncharacterized protein LOC126816202 [Patella vulgata]
MQALQWNRVDMTLKNVSAKIPEVTDDYVLVEVSHAGVCGTDLHIMAKEFRSSDLVILGHEFSGTVVKVGKNVKNVAVGQRVAVEPNSICGGCSFCRRGKPNFCKDGLAQALGVMNNGGFSNFCLVPGTQAIPVPDSLPLDKAALCEPYSCVVHGYELLGKVEDGSNILIMGAGIIGLLWGSMLHHRGFRNVTMVEVADGRRQLAKDAGLGFDVLHPSALEESFKGKEASEDGFDIVVDCTGNSKAIEMAFYMLKGGGKLLIFGCAPPTAEIKVKPAQIQFKELSIIGVQINPYCFTKAVTLVSDMADKYLDFKRLGIEVFTLNQYETAISKLKAGQISKAMFCVKKE